MSEKTAQEKYAPPQVEKSFPKPEEPDEKSWQHVFHVKR
jgi:hypothetical protein